MSPQTTQPKKKSDKPRTLRELMKYRENQAAVLSELTPLPLFDEHYPIAESESFEVDFILASDTSKIVLEIQRDVLATNGQMSFEKSTRQMFPTIEQEEKDRKEEEEEEEDFTDVTIVSLVRHFEDPGELIAEDANKVPITLIETKTISLLDVPSATAQRGSEEGDLVQRDNEYYEHVKAQNRMLVSAETQTPIITKKTQSAVTDAIVTRNIGHMATIWKIFDAFVSDAVSTPSHEISATSHSTFLGSMDALPTVEITSSSLEEQLWTIMRSDKFRKAVMRMEHVLASNVFGKQQTQFKIGFKRELSVVYNYKLQLLWTFSNEELRGRTVTSMSWSPANENLLAVGYGKFFYGQRITGMVCCWSIMNPVNPLKSFRFETPVTAIHFSKDRPNLLAVGLYDGSLVILDVAAKSNPVLAQSTRETSPSYKPLWHVEWLEGEDFSTEAQVLTGCQDGRISQYLMAANLVCFNRMRVQRMEGEIKGIEHPRFCRPLDIPVFRYSAALVIARSPKEPIEYLVGTDEGMVHKCSLTNHHQHLGVFLAHVGPLYSLQFCPFDSKLLLTCGADSRLRVWGEGISEALLTLSASNNPALGTAWSPHHSTILASIDQSHIFLWDLQRRTSGPVSIQASLDQAVNTRVLFSSTGLNVAVGDNSGCVHLYSLTDTPPPPFRQARALRHALYKSLSTNPELLRKVKKL